MKRSIIPLVNCAITIFVTMWSVLFIGHLLDPKGAAVGFDVIEAFDELEDNTMDVIYMVLAMRGVAVIQESCVRNMEFQHIIMDVIGNLSIRFGCFYKIR